MFQTELKEYVAENPSLVKMRVCGEGMYLLKYTKQVFYKGLWNKYLEECRGTIIDAEFNVISRPFTKIYNYGIEDSSPVLHPNELVRAFRKVNGFMATITSHNGELLISTTGSTDSPFVQYIRDMIDIECYAEFCNKFPTYTFMFECVHPEDPHIVPEDIGMYLLGYRTKLWESSVSVERLDEFAKQLQCFVPAKEILTVAEVCETVKTVKHEGFVFYTMDGRVGAKLKSPFYLANKFVVRNPRTDKLLKQSAKEIVDEEYYGLIDDIRANIDVFTALTEQERLVYVRKFLGA